MKIVIAILTLLAVSQSTVMQACALDKCKSYCYRRYDSSNAHDSGSAYDPGYAYNPNHDKELAQCIKQCEEMYEYVGEGTKKTSSSNKSSSNKSLLNTLGVGFAMGALGFGVMAYKAHAREANSSTPKATKKPKSKPISSGTLVALAGASAVASVTCFVVANK
jgi:hypothetical protein